MRLARRGVVVFFLIFTLSPLEADYTPPLITIPYVDKSPVIDGVFSFMEWELATMVTGFQNIMDAQLSQQLQPEVYLCFDEQYLYVAFVSPFTRPLKREISGRDENIWNDDSFEIFIDPGRIKSTYYHFVFGPNGLYYDAKVTPQEINKYFDSNLLYKSSVKEDKWIGEIAIPMRDIKADGLPDGEVWGFNICRNYKNPDEYTSLSYTGGSYHNPASFGKIIFKKDGPSLRVRYPDNPQFGEVSLDIGVRSKVDGEMVYKCFISKDDITVFQEEKRISIDRGEEKKIRIDKSLEIGVEQKFYIVSFSLQDKEGTPLFSQQIRFLTVHFAEVSYKVTGLKKEFVDINIDLHRYPKTAELGKVLVELGDSEGKQVIDGKEMEDSSKCHRFRIAIADIQPGNYYLTTYLYDKQGNLLGRYRKKFVKPDEKKWLGNKIYIDNTVPPPFIPLKVVGETISCWNRKYTFGDNPFPIRVEIEKKQILASPIALKGRINGKEVNWQRMGDLKFIEKRGDLIRLETNNIFSSVALKGTTDIEFDGMIKVVIDIVPERETNLEQLYLEIPLKKEYISLRSIPLWPYLTDDWRNYAYAGIGYIPDEWKARFIPYIWLGNEEGGICWFAENDKGWRLKDEERAIEIKREKDVVMLKINIIDHPVQLIETMTLTFGLQATPVKPLPENWLYFRDHRTGLKGKGNFIAPQIGRIYKWLGFPEVKDNVEVPYSEIYVGKKNIYYAQFVQEARKIGLKFLAYVTDQTAFFSSVEEESLPEFLYYRDDWDTFKYGDVLSYSEDPVLKRGALIGVCPKTSWQDFFIYNLKNFMEKYKIDGIFVDHAGVVNCHNISHGCGFERNGNVKPTYPIFATREMRKRVYKMFKSLNKDTLIIHHINVVPIIPLASFCDAYVGGEPLWGVVDTDRHQGDYMSALPLDVFRAEFSGQHFGLVPLIIPELHKEKYNTVENTETLVALCLLHGTNIYYGWCQHYKVVDKVWQAQDEFGMVGVEILPYWNNSDVIQPSSSNVKVTVYKKNGKALLAIVNLEDKEVLEKIRINYAGLGLQKDKIQAKDLISGLLVPLEKDNITLSIMKKNFRIIQLSDREW